MAVASYEKRALDRILLENGRLEKIKRVLAHQDKHMLKKGAADVHILASLEYPWYQHQWLRDSSKGIMNMIETASFLNDFDLFDTFDIKEGEIERKLSAAINTMWRSLYFFSQDIKKGEIRDIRDHASKLGKNHILARFDILDNGNVSLCEPDKDQPNTFRSWLMQYDSVPLTLIATMRFIDSFGENNIKYGLDTAKSILPWLVSYMQNYYNTPCADAWELYYNIGKINGIDAGNTIDSYSVAAIYSGIETAKMLSKLLGVYLPKETDSAKVEDFLLEHFISEIPSSTGRILCKSKIEHGELMKSIDSSAIDVFRLFKPPRITGSRVEDDTIRAVEQHLMEGSPLPIRFKFFDKHSHIKDTYFFGGNWFPNAEEYAMYKLAKGDINKAKETLDFIESRIEDDGSIPEQTLIKPASQGYDPEHYFERNGNKMIRCLWWSETGYLGLISMYARKIIASANSKSGAP